MPATLLPLAAALSHVKYPQTTTKPASASMRAADVLLERQAPWVVVALAMGVGVQIHGPGRGHRDRRARTPGPACAAHLESADLTHFASLTTIVGGMFDRTDSSLVHWILNANTLRQGSTMPGFPVPAKDMKPLVAWLQSLR